MTERLWCMACGTVTRDKTCDCNRYGALHEMFREPSFVNYADAMQEAAHEQAQRVAALEKALREIDDLDDQGRYGRIAREALAAVSTQTERGNAV